MRLENHTPLDCDTRDEYSDLKRLEMVFTSLPASGVPDTLCHLCSGGGRNDRTLEPMLKVGIVHGSSSSIRRWSGFAANCSAILC